ncbi:hypothetical protein FB192DRAFT_1293365, partial [Mucor lusitanicus]
ITSWLDATSSSPVGYLGFPLFTSVDKIHLGCQIHKQRGLYVRDRATVLNSLVLSRLWHVIRVVTVPVGTLDSIQSMIA